MSQNTLVLSSNQGYLNYSTLYEVRRTTINDPVRYNITSKKLNLNYTLSNFSAVFGITSNGTMVTLNLQNVVCNMTLSSFNDFNKTVDNDRQTLILQLIGNLTQQNFQGNTTFNFLISNQLTQLAQTIRPLINSNISAGNQTFNFSN